MSVFADSSALVKLYADEPGHQIIRTLEGLIVSALARVEVPAALWRKQRLGELASSDAELLVAAFEADFQGTADERPAFAAVALSADVLDAAAEVSATQGLRAYDAVQLASALAARAVDLSCIHFACFDGQLRDGAARSGFGLVPDYQGQ